MSNPEQPDAGQGTHGRHSQDGPEGADRPTTEPQGSQPTGTEPTDHTGTEPQGTTTAAKIKPKVRGSRTGAVWTTLVIAAVVLILLLIFILQNLQKFTIHFFGASANLPGGVALLLAAVGGILLVALPGYGRILQLRRQVRKGATGRQ